MIMSFQAVFAIMFNGCTGIMGKFVVLVGSVVTVIKRIVFKKNIRLIIILNRTCVLDASMHWLRSQANMGMRLVL